MDSAFGAFSFAVPEGLHSSSSFTAAPAPQAWAPTNDAAMADYWDSRDLADGLAPSWTSRSQQASVFAQGTSAAQPTKGVTGLVFDGGDSMTRLKPGAKFLSAQTIPNSSYGVQTPGKGFACTGADYETGKGSWVVCNHGLNVEGDSAALYNASLVGLSLDGSTKLWEIDLKALGWTGSTQGVGVTSTTYWVNDTAAGTYKEMTKAGVLTGRVITPSWVGSGCAYDVSRDALWCGQRSDDGSGLELRKCSDNSLLFGPISTGLANQDSLFYRDETKTLIFSWAANGVPGNFRVYDASNLASLKNLGDVTLTIEAAAIEGTIWDGGTRVYSFNDGWYHNGTLNQLTTYQVSPLVSDVVEEYGIVTIPAVTGVDAITSLGDAVTALGYGWSLLTGATSAFQQYGQTGETGTTSRASYLPTIMATTERIYYARWDRAGQLLSSWVDGTSTGSAAATVWTRPFPWVGSLQLGNAPDSARQPTMTLKALGVNMGSGDRQKTEGYLAWQFGLQANLPVGHPYKNSAPTV